MTGSDGAGTAPGDRWRRHLAEHNGTNPPAGANAGGPDRTEMFRWRPEETAERRTRPSLQPALEALPQGGSVLDVGVGGGSSSLVLAPRVGFIVGVDRDEDMLASFRESAGRLGVPVQTVLGAWPEVAGEVEPVDVAVSHHALYGVAAIEEFVLALTERARHRVVVELLAHPPNARLDPLWKAFHGTERPDWLVADDAQAVLEALGLSVDRVDRHMPARPRPATPAAVRFARSRLGVGAERDPEIAAFLAAQEPAGEHLVSLSWPGLAA